MNIFAYHIDTENISILLDSRALDNTKNINIIQGPGGLPGTFCARDSGRIDM